MLHLVWFFLVLKPQGPRFLSLKNAGDRLIHSYPVNCRQFGPENNSVHSSKINSGLAELRSNRWKLAPYS